MANNLRRFANEAEYSAATLSYPAVSWITSGDTLHYDLSGSTPPTPVVNDKVIIAAYGGNGEGTFTYFNCEASSSGDITSILFDNVEVNPITCEGDYLDAEQTYIVKYTLNTTSVGDWCTSDLGCGAASEPSKVDILYPAQITEIDSHYPSNTYVIVCEATTPPTVEGLGSTLGYDTQVYVPDSAVNDYKSDVGWGEMSESIHPISEYSGNLPV